MTARALALTLAACGFIVAQGSVVAQGFSPASATVTTSDGATIHCLEVGTGPAILFVPGWTMPAEIFAPRRDGRRGARPLRG
jgi:hypothetical protein